MTSPMRPPSRQGTPALAPGRADLAAPRLRDASASDAEQVARIWNRMIQQTLATFTSTLKTPALVRDLMAARHADGHGFIVAADPTSPAAILGFATYGQFRGGVGYARTLEHSVVLDEGAQGKGLGRALMQRLEDHARAGGGHSMMAGVSAENPSGLRFHAAVGYAEVARLRDVGFKRGRYLDLVLMQKML